MTLQCPILRGTMANPIQEEQLLQGENELITKRELSRRLRVSQRKIELDNHLPCIRWGRSVRYDWSSVLEYLRTKGGDA